MKQLLIGTSLMCLSTLAIAGQKVDQTIDAAKDGYVEIEHLGGYANIKGWDKEQVRVVGELGDKTEDFIFKRDGNEVVIEVKVKHKRGNWGNWGSDDGDRLDIYVPKDSRLNYTSTNGDVEVVDISGGSEVETVNGDIEVDSLSGRVRLEAVNGDIVAKKVSGDVKIETVNGDIRDTSENKNESVYESVNGDILVTSNSREVKAVTVNGDVELNLQTVEQLNLDTVNGSIEARLTLAKQGDVRASTVGGAVSLYFQQNVSARFDIQAHAGGRISNKISNDSVQKAKYGPSRWLEFSVNGGQGRVDVSTVSGRIKLDTQ